jgi:chaperone LolA
MKKISFPLSLLIIFLFCPGAFAITSGMNQSVHTSEKLALKVEKKYRSIKDLSMNFTKTLKSEIFETQKKTKGKMYLKNPDKFRIETKDETIVTDGKFLWTYSEQNEQVIKSRLDRSKNIFKPNQYLSNFRKEYKAKLTDEEKINKTECYRLVLTPKKEDSFITKTIIWIDKKSLLAKKLEYQDSNDNQITLIFDKIKINKGIKDSKFVFKAPEGVEELDLTE